MKLIKIYASVKKELNKVKKIITETLKDADGEVLEMSKHIISSKGKMIRPIFVILCAKLGGEEVDKEVLHFAAAVEILHMASLVHDDIMDMSKTRHNIPTINSKWDNYAAMVYGDFLISAAVEQASYCRQSIINRMSKYMKQMCQGQTIQLINRDNLKLSEKTYQEIIEMKTAAFFEAACELGAKIGDEKNSSNLKEFAHNFGVAFQLIDDCLDFEGDSKKMGKKTGENLRLGELTLPVILLLKKASGDDKKELLNLLNSKDEVAVERISKKIDEYGIKSEIVEKIDFYTQKARDSLNRLPNSTSKDAFIKILDFSVSRIK
ncbi:polyprenyl synthetase family protein [Candidatus Woesearchaeota archaeon]|nr:polyprenyl synthetase family protein [Candidatus Woesearchaeota archaeon]